MRFAVAAANAVPLVVAILCVLAFLPWLMGVPGVRGNAYARGWEIGLQAIMIYPTVFVVLRILEALAGYGWLWFSPSPFRMLIWLALAAFVVAQVTAWSLIVR